MNQQFVKIFVSVAIRDGDKVLLVQEGKQDWMTWRRRRTINCSRHEYSKMWRKG